MDWIFYLDKIENLLWITVGVPTLMLLGLYLSIKTRFFQVRKFPTVCRTFFRLALSSEISTSGVPPLKAFYACIGGCVGVGNIVGICTAIQIGGPGALFWIWVTAIVGMIIKYSEVYLGVRFRQKMEDGTYAGGPMYFIQQVTENKWIPSLIALLLCIYGVEIYQFSVITTSIATNFHIPQTPVVMVLVSLVIFAGSGGVKRVGAISSKVIPLFIILYTVMGGWVLLEHFSQIPEMIYIVFSSAFKGSAAVGGFVGSTLMLAISQGVRRGCYTADIGVGYASVIHSETSLQKPQTQASLVIFDIFIDTFVICTMSVLLILMTGVWQEPMDASQLVLASLGQSFPGMHFFMPLFLFLLGYSTINAYFCVGLKCARYLSPSYGGICFYLYSVPALIIFSYVDSTYAQSLMAISGGLLLIINSWGIWKLKDEVSFDLEEEKESAMATT